MATPVEITYRVVGADQVAGALTQMENRARQMSSAMTSTMAPARQGVSALSSALSGAATILRLTGGESQALARNLEVATLAISATAVAVQTLRGATLAWTGAMVAANAAMTNMAAIAAAIGAAVLAVFAAPFAAAALAAGGLVTTLALLKPELFGFKTAIAEVSAEVDLGVIRAASWVKAWSNLDTAFQLVMGSAADLHLELRGLLGVTDELAGKWRVGITKITTEQEKESARLAETARREAAAHQKLADAIQEARMQRGLDLIVQTNVAERARATVAGLRQQAQFLRDAADASTDWAQIERDLVIPAMRAAVDLFQSFKTPAEEGVIRPANQITENFEELADAARAASRVLGVEWAEALTVARQVLQMAKEEGIGLADALARIKFTRDFLIELELVESGMKKWFDAWEKIKFGIEDFNIQSAIDPALAALDQLAARAKEMKQAIGQAFGDLFSDILFEARSFGDALSNFFRAILQHFILRIILPFFGLQQGGIVAGGLTPLFAAQGGGIVSRPTLALMGEGGQNEIVLTRRQARDFIGLDERGGGQAAGPREAVIHLTIHNVIGDPRAMGIMTAGDVAGVIVNDVSRRGPTIQAIRVALS